MMFYLLLFNVILFPKLIFCNNITTSNVKVNVTQPIQIENLPKIGNGTTPHITEGGPILPASLGTALRENEALELDNIPGKSKIKGRKGAEFTLGSSDESVTIKTVTSGERLNTSIHQLKVNTSKELDDIKVLNSSVTSTVVNTNKPVNKTEKIKKPLVLRSDILESITVKSSPETLSQVQSPNKVNLYHVNKHPGMVMPIVITILLVPMFAVLGFMALKRGQEAWKNRHYKRMDFLLDGMYND